MKNTLKCSFCGKLSTEVQKLISANEKTSTVTICNECVDACVEILSQQNVQKEESKRVINPDPKKIKEFLDSYIIGQEHAKKVISVATANHYKRITSDENIDKSNIILIGPSGSGKTLLAQTLAKFLDVPLAIADATSLTSAGYVGDDVETIIGRLLQIANNDKELAEKGIIFIDEIDKKSKKSESMSITRDVSGEEVQQSLLKLIEGDIIRVPISGNRKHPNGEVVEINTKNILFIVGGAFVGITDVIESRVSKKNNSIGFGAQIDKKTMSKNELLKLIDSEDLIRYGMTPEFVGRVPVIAHTEELSKEQLIQVLSEPKNSVIEQFKKLFEIEGIKLEFDDTYLNKVADVALKKQVGARGLRSIIEKTLLDVQFNIKEYTSKNIEKVVITEDIFETNTPVLIISTQKSKKSFLDNKNIDKDAV